MFRVQRRRGYLVFLGFPEGSAESGMCSLKGSWGRTARVPGKVAILVLSYNTTLALGGTAPSPQPQNPHNTLKGGRPKARSAQPGPPHPPRPSSPPLLTQTAFRCPHCRKTRLLDKTQFYEGLPFKLKLVLSSRPCLLSVIICNG